MDRSIGLLVKSMQGDGDFDVVDRVMVSGTDTRIDWKVMENRKFVSWDWARKELQKRAGEYPELAKKEVHEIFVGSAEQSMSTHKANVLITFEGAPDTLWVLCGLNTGFILNLGFWEKGRLVTDAAD